MDRDQVAAALAAIDVDVRYHESELALLGKRRSLLSDLLGTFDEPVARKVAPAERKGKRGGAIPSHSEEVTCPDCGQRMRRGGLGPHRAHKHKDSAAKPVELAPVDDVDDKPLVFVCGDCGFRSSRELTLERHVEEAHGRELRAAERFRVQAA